MNKHQFGLLLKEKRDLSRKSPKDVADHLGIGERQIYRYEKGDLLPDLEQIAKISQFLNFDFFGHLSKSGQPSFEHNSYLKAIQEREKERENWLTKIRELDAENSTNGAKIAALEDMVVAIAAKVRGTNEVIEGEVYDKLEIFYRTKDFRKSTLLPGSDRKENIEKEMKNDLNEE